VLGAGEVEDGGGGGVDTSTALGNNGARWDKLAMFGSGGVPLLWVRKEACCRSWPAAEGLTAADEEAVPAIAAAVLADTGGLNAAPVRLLLRGLGNVIIVVGVVGVGFGLLSMLDT